MTNYEPTWRHTRTCDYCASQGHKQVKSNAAVDSGCDHYRGGKTRAKRMAKVQGEAVTRKVEAYRKEKGLS